MAHFVVVGKLLVYVQKMRNIVEGHESESVLLLRKLPCTEEGLW